MKFEGLKKALEQMRDPQQIERGHILHRLKNILIGCFFQKPKWFRKIITRYDKLDASFPVFVYFASIAILLI